MNKIVPLIAIATLTIAGCDQNQSKDASTAAPAGAGSATGGAQGAGIWAVGSSTVFPFATRVAENYARKSGGAAPKVESLGTGGGFKAFCAGAGAGTPDIANASRPMKASEFDTCRKNGVTDIVEIKIGFDGIVIASAKSGPNLDLSQKDLFLALGKEVPQGAGFAANPYKTWSQVRAGLPATRIQVYGPPPTSGTRDAFVELATVKGGESFPAVKALKDSDEDRFKALTETLREDGAWIDSGENDNAIVQTLTRTPGSLGVFGFSFLEQNADQVKAVRVNGVAPSIAAIADGSYPLSRSLFIYVKKAHLDSKPGLRAFLSEFTSDAAMARGGYLQDRGLIPLPADQLAAQKQAATSLTPMSRPAK
ncbi:MAG TPA: substrate-binding domain-containing protein [Caulobacteraceae bacterium]|nr:substrate-binding domain-containing protein [Caulobacteraceae bacterium]